jgi:hypothetical protein
MNVDAGQFCASCGKALPSAAPGGPHVVTGETVATTAVGRTVQAEQLRKQAGRAFGVLLFVGILNVVVGVGFYFLVQGRSAEADQAARLVLTVCLIVGGIYVGLALWSRRNPLPAAIIGLVIYVSLQLIAVVQNPQMYLRLAIVIPVIIIIVGLLRAIQAGVKHKQLREQMTV